MIVTYIDWQIFVKCTFLKCIFSFSPPVRALSYRRYVILVLNEHNKQIIIHKIYKSRCTITAQKSSLHVWFDNIKITCTKSKSWGNIIDITVEKNYSVSYNKVKSECFVSKLLTLKVQPQINQNNETWQHLEWIHSLIYGIGTCTFNEYVYVHTLINGMTIHINESAITTCIRRNGFEINMSSVLSTLD